MAAGTRLLATVDMPSTWFGGHFPPRQEGSREGQPSTSQCRGQRWPGSSLSWASPSAALRGSSRSPWLLVIPQEGGGRREELRDGTWLCSEMLLLRREAPPQECRWTGRGD